MSDSNGDKVIIKQNYEQSLHGKRRQKTNGCLLGEKSRAFSLSIFILYYIEDQHPAKA